MKTLVITGISRGIGLETAKVFLNNGWFVIGTSKNGLSPLKHEYLKIYNLDLSKSQQIDNFVNKLQTFDILINNAAVLLETWDEVKVDMSQLKETFAINVFGTIELTEKCIPKLNAEGQIINISSGWGSFSSNDSPHQPQYKMSKASLNMYTKLLAERLDDVTVSSFDPGWVKTDMGTKNAIKLPTETAAEIYSLAIIKKESGYFWHEGKIREW